MTDAIERVCLTHLQVPWKEHARIGRGDGPVADAILVGVQAGGVIGIGECVPAASGWAKRPDEVEACWKDLLDRIAPDLLGRTIADEDEIARVAFRWLGARPAVAGAECALWDLLGQTQHRGIAEMLGAGPALTGRGVEAGLAVGLYPTIVDLLRVIEGHLVEGYRRLKIRIEPGRDVDLVRAVRQHFGDIPLMVDAQGAYNANHLDVFRELDRHDLLMIEQPMAAGDLVGLATLQAAVSTPICLDETAVSIDHTSEAIRRGACRVVTLKLQRLGGIGPTRALHDLCLAHDVACWVGTSPETGIGQAHGIHLATLPNCKYPTDIGPGVRWFVDEYTSPRIEMTAPGLLAVPTRPGLGYHVDPAQVRRYLVRHERIEAKVLA